LFASKGEDEVSWFQEHPAPSLEMVARAGVGLEARIIDIGGGASRLVDALLAKGWRNLAALDLVQAARPPSGGGLANGRAPCAGSSPT
jgi:hypothetical protein